MVLHVNAHSKLSPKQQHHRRGAYDTMGNGVLFGNGRVVPGITKNTKHNQKLLDEFFDNWAVKEYDQILDGEQDKKYMRDSTSKILTRHLQGLVACLSLPLPPCP